MIRRVRRVVCVCVCVWGGGGGGLRWFPLYYNFPACLFFRNEETIFESPHPHGTIPSGLARQHGRHPFFLTPLLEEKQICKCDQHNFVTNQPRRQSDAKELVIINVISLTTSNNVHQSFECLCFIYLFNGMCCALPDSAIVAYSIFHHAFVNFCIIVYFNQMWK